LEHVKFAIFETILAFPFLLQGSEESIVKSEQIPASRNRTLLHEIELAKEISIAVYLGDSLGQLVLTQNTLSLPNTLWPGRSAAARASKCYNGQQRPGDFL
jgi:hypothetical protein